MNRVASFQRYPLCKTVRHLMDRMTGELRHSAQREVMALDGLIARDLQKNQKLVHNSLDKNRLQN